VKGYLFCTHCKTKIRITERDAEIFHISCRELEKLNIIKCNCKEQKRKNYWYVSKGDAIILSVPERLLSEEERDRLIAYCL